jgi:hypothetical protein
MSDDYTVIAEGCVHPYCAPDDEAPAPAAAAGPVSKCAVCAKDISGKFVSLGGKRLHSACVKCERCSGVISGGYVESPTGGMLCASCGSLKAAASAPTGARTGGFTVDPRSGQRVMR